MQTVSPLILFGSYAVVLILALYVFVYIPNGKKRRKMQNLHDSLKEGDRVVTIGGLCGRIAARDGGYVTLVVDEEKDVRVRVVVYAVRQVLAPEEN